MRTTLQCLTKSMICVIGKVYRRVIVYVAVCLVALWVLTLQRIPTNHQTTTPKPPNFDESLRLYLHDTQIL